MNVWTNMHELNGITAALVESTGLEGSEAGTAIRAILSRTFGLGRDGSDGKGMKTLKSIANVDVRDGEGQFKSFAQVLGEVDNKWGKLTKNQQIALAQAVGGREHYSKFLSIMENYKTVINATNYSINSQNSAYSENQKYLNSTEGKINQLKVSMERLNADTLNTSFVKGTIDGTTSFINTIDKLVNKFGMFKVVMGTFSIGMALFSSKFKEGSLAYAYWNGLDNILKKIGITMKNTSTQTVNAFKNIPNLIQATKNAVFQLNHNVQLGGGYWRTLGVVAKTSLNGIITSVKKTIAVVKALGIVTKLTKAAFTFGLSLVIDAVITKAYELFDNVINKAEKLKEHVQDVNSNALGNIQNNNKNYEQLTQLGKEYDILKSKTKLSKEEQQKMYDIQNQIAQICPEIVRGYDSQGNAIVKIKNGTKGLIEALKEKNKLENSKLANNFDNTKENYNNEVKKNGGKIDKAVKEKNDLISQRDNQQKEIDNMDMSSWNSTSYLRSAKSNLDDLNKAIEKQNAVIDDNKGKLAIAKMELDKLRNPLLVTAQGYDKLSDSQKEMANSIWDTVETVDLSKPKAQEIIDLLNNKDFLPIIEQITNLQNGLKNGKITSEQFRQSFEKIIEKASKIKGINVNNPTFKKFFNEVIKESKKGKRGLDSFQESVESLQKEVTESLDNIKKYGKFLNEIKENGTLSSASKEEIIKAEPDLLPLLDNNNINKLSEELNKRIDEYKNKSIEAYAVIRSQQESDSITKLINDYKTLSEIKDSTPQQNKELSDTVERLKEKVDDLTISEDENGRMVITNIGIAEEKQASLLRETKYLQAVKECGKEKAKEAILDEINQTDEVYKQIESRIDGYKKEYDDIMTIINNMRSIPFLGEFFGNITENMYKSKMNELENKINKSKQELSKRNEENKAKANEYAEKYDKDAAKSAKEYNNVINTLTDSTKKNTDATKENTEAVNKAKEALKGLEIQLKELDLAYQRIESRLKHMSKGSEEYRQALREQQEIVKQRIANADESISISSDISGDLFNRAGQYGSGNKAAINAKRYLGTPYLWGGKDPSAGGIDCSGLVELAYKPLGVNLSGSTFEQIKKGTSVSRSQLQPGDLVFFGSSSNPHHVGIYVGNEKYIHAPKTGDVVKISSLNNRNDFLTAKRIVSGENSNGYNTSSNFNTGYSGKYANYINEAGQKYGINPNLIAALIKQESDFRNLPINHAGAMGIMQVTRGAAEDSGFSGANLMDIKTNILAGTAELKRDLAKANGDPRLAVGYYNAGLYGNLNNQETQNHMKKVMGYYQQLGGGKAVTDSDNMHNVINEAQDAYEKMLGFEQKKMNDNDLLFELRKKEYEDILDEFNKKVKDVDEKIKQINLDGEYGAKNDVKNIKLLKNIVSYNNDKLKIIKEEKDVIEKEIKRTDYYDVVTIDEMKIKNDELTTSIKEMSKAIKEASFQWVESQLQNIKQRIQENVDMVENAISRLDSMPTVDLNKKVILSSQLVDLDKQNIEELTKLIKDLNEEEAKTGDVFLFEKIKELNGELDKLNTKLAQDKKTFEEVKNAMGDLASNIEDKIKQVIQKNNELYKQSLEKNLKLFEEAVDNELKKLEDAERKMQHNESEFDQVNKIAEIQQKLNRLDLNNSIEAKQQRLDLEKELQQELRTQRENELKYEIENRKSSLQKAKDEYSKELDKNNNKLAELDTDENLTSQAKQALLNGYITDLNNNVISLDSALTTFEDKFGKGLGVLGNKIKKESIDNLHEVQDILKQFGTLDVTKINPNEQIRNIYGKGVDLENTKKILGIQGYKYIDVDLIDQSKLALTPDDIVVGGQGTTVDRLDLNGAMRLGGKERGETEQIIQIFRDIQNDKIQKQNGTVYGSGVDLLNAKKWLAALGYNFIDTATTNVNASEIGTNDFVVGGSLARGGVGFNVQNRLGGKDRYETDKAIEKKFHELIAQITNSNYRKNAYSIGTVYGSGSDLESARKYLTKFGYRFIETNNVEDIDLKPYDIVVGGTGVMKGQDRIINSRANWFDGQNRNETLQKIINFANKLNGFPVNTQGFSKGGVVDFTGYAMVHGGNGHDEVMLNNGQATNLYNFIKNIPNYVKNMASQINYPVVNNNNINQKDWLNKLELTGAGDTYDIKIEVNGDLKATEDEANEFASRIINKLRKRG